MDVDLKIPQSLTYLLMPSAVTDEDHVCQTWWGGGGQNCDIHLKFLGPRLRCSYRHYVTITKPRSASLRSAIMVTHSHLYSLVHTHRYHGGSSRRLCGPYPI